MKRLHLSWMIVVATVAVAHADERSLFERRAASDRAVKRGRVAAMGSRRVDVGGRGTTTIKALFDRVFADQQATNAALARAGGALFAPPVVEDEVLETDDATVLRMTTRLTVADPGKLRSAVPQLRTYGGSEHATIATLDPKAKAGYERFKAEVTRKPAGHPLKLALDRGGDDGLLAAIGQGLGELEITTSVTVPKRGLAVAADGRLKVPAQRDDLLDFTSTVTSPLRAPLQVTSAAVAAPTPPPATTIPSSLPADGSGVRSDTWAMVAGDTKGDTFEWEKKWKFPSGYFKASAQATYAFGLRIPIEVTTSMRPTARVDSTAPDTASTYAVAVSARAFDAVSKFYTNAGMDPALIYDGQELVLQLGAWAKVELSAGWGVIELSKKFPKDLNVDKSRNFTPPFGDCGTACGFDLWLPSKLTRTEIDLGIVKAGAEVGFLVGGKGTVGLRYTSLYRGTTPSTLDDVTAASHTLRFSSTASKGLSTTMSALTRPGTEPYGFRLDQLDYDWKVELTPGIRVNVTVNAKPFFKIEETIGPLWLSFVEIPVGTFDFDAHPGTRSVIESWPGTKIYAEETASRTPAPSTVTR